jgi:hypothetical protein
LKRERELSRNIIQNGVWVSSPKIISPEITSPTFFLPKTSFHLKSDPQKSFHLQAVPKTAFAQKAVPKTLFDLINFFKFARKLGQTMENCLLKIKN